MLADEQIYFKIEKSVVFAMFWARHPGCTDSVHGQLAILHVCLAKSMTEVTVTFWGFYRRALKKENWTMLLIEGNKISMAMVDSLLVYDSTTVPSS